MKNIIIVLLIFSALFAGCDEGDDTDNTDDSIETTYYREQMRKFVINISDYAKGKESSFLIIPQNGQELVTDEESGTTFLEEYLDAVDGTGREDLFYGYDEDNEPTPSDETEYLVDLLDIAKANGIVNLVTDYCWKESYMSESYRKNSEKGYISFAADSRDLDTIPSYPSAPYNENSSDITSLQDAKNFLYIIDPGRYSSKTLFRAALMETNYDLIIMDAFYDDEIFTQSEIDVLKRKKNGGSRLVIAYMSIGEAEDYRYYWKPEWNSSKPSWIDRENPDWEGNYKVKYWETEWQAVIFGSDSAYLDKILGAGFDGVYLDIIDAFEYYE